ncbi:MAG: putative transcriptional regulator, Crp/Fnr family [Hyphomicrobiales bacterium]|nr:putative transcriptional regulator, Crp/Fnr family [Hyphomicrobiales bacterium]
MNSHNRFLLTLSEHDRDILIGRMSEVDLACRQVLSEPGKCIEFVYFPETCVCSILAVTANILPIEVGMIGFEGASDFVSTYGDTAAFRLLVQVAGRALRIGAQDFALLFASLPGLRALTFRYREAMAIQFAYTALAHGSLTIEARLARWLLMTNDRSRQVAMPLVHEFMASMLAVRRSGVTTAIHILEGAGAIRASRGSIVIRDREKLMQLTGGSYGVPEREYERLMRT